MQIDIRPIRTLSQHPPRISLNTTPNIRTSVSISPFRPLHPGLCLLLLHLLIPSL